MHSSPTRPRKLLLLEELEPRLVLNGPTINVPLDPHLDQFGDQVITVQAYGDDSRATFGIFDTGSAVVSFSSDDQAAFEPPIPVKVPGGAYAAGAGGRITGDVSRPGTILATGMHGVNLNLDDIFAPIQ